jgi:hypothetical protein
MTTHTSVCWLSLRAFSRTDTAGAPVPHCFHLRFVKYAILPGLAMLQQRTDICRGRTRKTLTHVIERLVSATPERDALEKPSPAHRLDKATGGIVTFVKTLRAAQQMEITFAKDRSARKRSAGSCMPSHVHTVV